MGTLVCCFEHESESLFPGAPAGGVTTSSNGKEKMIEVLHDRVAGLDVHKQTVVACVRSPGPGRSRRAETREFETFIDDLERLRDWLVAEGVTHVAMEATGIYWKPVWFVLEDGGFELLLVNARNMRMVPGRKTDVADAGWIAIVGVRAVARQSRATTSDP